MKTSVERQYPVLSLENLRAIGDLSHGITVYNEIIIVWGEDYDARVMSLLDDHFTGTTRRPFAIRESKGHVDILWKLYEDYYDYHSILDEVEVDGDMWSAKHYLVGEDGVASEILSEEEHG